MRNLLIVRPILHGRVFRGRECLRCILLVGAGRADRSRSTSIILGVDVSERNDCSIIKPLSHKLLLPRQLKLQRFHLVALDNMRQKRIHVLKEHTLLALAEGKTGRHAVHDPRAGLDDSTLRNWQLGVELVH